MATKQPSKRWQWIVGGAVVAGVIVLSSEHIGGVGGSRPCTMKVTVETLDVRSGPDSREPVVETLAADAVVPADRTTRNGFRQLGPNRWAAQLYLDPVPGSNCG